ncbi:class I SAM-dependent methyltransferase [Streptomyces sp. NPDC001941]|uniref:class I SAM-dependent methyltransferase n=1 Tax=Streptomyces sp. NPDC001941 TaxID=3154659 RepID=UPI00332F8462
MLPNVKNMLYSSPELYDEAWAGMVDDIADTIRHVSQTYLTGAPGSILDAGCGTGRDLGELSTYVADCTGVDVQEPMVNYAASQHENITFQVADLRSMELGRQYEFVYCVGLVLSNLHDDNDFHAALSRLAVHTLPGGLFVMEVVNRPEELATDMPCDFTVGSLRGQSVYRMEHGKLIRERLWRSIDDESAEPVRDYVEFRTTSSDEGRAALARHGFEVLQVHDNRLLRPSEELNGWRLVFVARKTSDGAPS